MAPGFHPVNGKGMLTDYSQTSRVPLFLRYARSIAMASSLLPRSPVWLHTIYVPPLSLYACAGWGMMPFGIWIIPHPSTLTGVNALVMWPYAHPRSQV